MSSDKKKRSNKVIIYWKWLFPLIKRIIFLLKNKGIKYIFNFIFFHLFFGSKNNFIIRLLHWWVPYPFCIEIEVTTRCPLKCTICEHTYWSEPDRNMSFKEFKGIVDQFPKLKWIGLTGIGSSFVNKDFMRMVELVKSRGIILELYDSFYLVNEDIAKKLVELEVDRILPSIDAATKQTYEKLRVGSDFNRVIENVKNFLKIKKEMDAHFPEVDFHYIVTKINYHEMTQFIELVHSIAEGCDVGIQFTRMLHEFEEIKDLFVEVPDKIIQEVRNKAKQLGVRIRWGADVPKIKPPIAKCTEWIMPFIFVTGHVIPCCAGNEAGRRDFQKKTALGNVFEQGFKEIWYGEKYGVFRKMLRKGKVPVQCKNCCIYNVKSNGKK